MKLLVSHKKTGYVSVKKEVIKRIEHCQENDLCFACKEPLGEGAVVRHAHERCYKALTRKETVDECIRQGLLAGDDIRRMKTQKTHPALRDLKTCK